MLAANFPAILVTVGILLKIKIRNMNEKLLEKKLKKEVEKLGGLCLKFTSPGYNGVPDRVILLAGGVFWAELKSDDAQLSSRQQFVRKEFGKKGHFIFIIRNEETLNDFLNFISKGNYR